MMADLEAVARVCHEANRARQRATGDRAVRFETWPQALRDLNLTEEN